MKLTTRTRYGTRALADLAERYDDGLQTTAEIAQRQAISAKYLEGLLTRLCERGLVVSVRGARGGYRLARPAAQITVKDIYQALEATTVFVPCVGEPQSCAHSADCMTHVVWREMYEASMSVLARYSLDQLVRRECSRHEWPGGIM